MILPQLCCIIYIYIYIYIYNVYMFQNMINKSLFSIIDSTCMCVSVKNIKYNNDVCYPLGDLVR